MVNVICMKWGHKYGPEYVNRLFNMVQRNLRLEHRFVCLTDNSTGLDARIETFPIPDLPISLSGPERGWKKLTTFGKSLHDLSGTTLFLDVDIIITGSLDEFFTEVGDVLIIKEWNARHGKGNSSVYRFTIGAHADVLSNFAQNFEIIRSNYRNEQAYLADYLDKKGALRFWPDVWVRSFKRHCMHYFPKSLFVPPTLPADTRVLIFHGYPLPDQAIVGETGKWYRTARPATWISTYWY
ncbi:MAG: glycosyltransferase [Methylotenera sp.]|nr:glycosyltransferase [Methylotenera sp.]